MIGDDVALALPELRAQAESLMVDVMTSKRATGQALDPSTDVITSTFAAGYAGRCQVTPFRQGHDTETGQVAVMRRGYQVTVPWASAPALQRGDIVTVTVSDDAWVVGRPLVVTEVNYVTFGVCRRLMVEDYS